MSAKSPSTAAPLAERYQSENKIRIVTATSLFDGHDAAINVMRRILQASGVEGLLTDQEGNLWNLFGEAVSGPRFGQHLPVITAFMGYWFSFAAFYPDPEIYN